MAEWFLNLGLVASGVFMSVALPILWYAVLQTMPKRYRTRCGPTSAEFVFYARLAVASLVTAALLSVMFRGAFTAMSPYECVLAGYAWDSTLQKLHPPPQAIRLT